jgi:hypothetical protein
MGALWSAAGRPAAPLRMRTFSTSAPGGVVKSQRSFLSALARTPGAVMDGPRLALSGLTRFRAVCIENRANPCRQIPLTVPRGTFLVPTPLDGVYRHGKSFALQRWMDRGTPRPLGQLFAHGNILASRRAAFNRLLDEPNCDAQSIRIESRRGRDATAMRGQTRISSPSGRPLERTRALARALWESLIRSRRIRAPPGPGPTRVAARQDVRRPGAV